MLWHDWLRKKFYGISMPRLYLPASVLPPPVPFPIGDREKADLIRVLKLDGLQPELCDAISCAIGCYQATKDGSRDTIVANTLAGLGELAKPGRAYERAVQRLADERSGVDYTTHQTLQPLAKAVLKDEPGSREAPAQAAASRWRSYERTSVLLIRPSLYA